MTNHNNPSLFEESNLPTSPVQINDEILTILYGLAERDKNILPDIQKLEKDPENFFLWISFGNRLAKTKNFESALECFDNAVHLKSNIPDAWYYRGQAFQKFGKYDKAIESFDKAIELDPKNSDVWDAKGLALGSLGKEDDARKCFDISKQLKQDKIVLLIDNAKNAIIEAKYEESVKSLDKADRYRS